MRLHQAQTQPNIASWGWLAPRKESQGGGGRLGERAAGLGELQLPAGAGKGLLALASHSLPVSLCPGSGILPSGLAGAAFQGELPTSWGTRCHPGPPLPLQEREEGAGSRPPPLACTCPGDPGPVAAGKGERQRVCVDTQRTPSLPLRRMHTDHHSVEEQLIFKREDVMDEGLLDIAGRFPCLSPGEL